MQRIATVLGALAMVAMAASAAAADTREFTVVSIENAGTKFWLPATLVVNQGDTVKITLHNKVMEGANTHGFTIPAFGVEKIVIRGEPATVEFTADKAGIFDIACHLHPPHVGGQLLVLEGGK